MRQRWAEENPDVAAAAGARAQRAADFVEDRNNRDEVGALLRAATASAVAPEVIRRTLDGRLKVSPDGAYRADARYLLVGRDGAARPDPAQAAWLYAQMVRWGQAPLSREMLAAAKARVAARSLRCGAGRDASVPGEPADGIGAFAGPAFDPDDIEAHLAAWTIKRSVG